MYRNLQKLEINERKLVEEYFFWPIFVFLVLTATFSVSSCNSQKDASKYDLLLRCLS